MNFNLTEEQELIRDTAREFAQKEIAPVAADFDASGEFPVENIRKMGELGLMGIEIPAEYGGAGMDTISYVLAMEEICAADAAHGTIMSVNNSLFCHGLMKFGTEEQRQEFLVPVASGAAVGAYALTEPQSGSDAATMLVRAVKSDDGSHYVINGKKSWISSGPYAKYMLVFAMTDPEQGNRGVTAFLIDSEREGFRTGKIEPKLGIRASATCEIELEDYNCPAGWRLGEEGDGFKVAMAVLDAGRIGIAAQSVGIARAAYEATLEYVRDRKAFGAPIGTFQMTQAKIADMKTRIEAAHLLTLQAAAAKTASDESGTRYSRESAMAKLFASETAMFVTHHAVQIHGGMGYSKELPVERYFRDAKITEIYEGTSEMLRLVIARTETGLR